MRISLSKQLVMTALNTHFVEYVNPYLAKVDANSFGLETMMLERPQVPCVDVPLGYFRDFAVFLALTLQEHMIMLEVPRL
jgi:hypothetical protein